MNVILSINQNIFKIVLSPEFLHFKSYGDAAATDFAGGTTRIQCQPNRAILLSAETDKSQRVPTTSGQERFLKCCIDRSEPRAAA